RGGQMPPDQADVDVPIAIKDRTNATLEISVGGTLNGAKLNYRVRAGPEASTTEVVPATSLPKSTPPIAVPAVPLQSSPEVVVQADFTVVQPAATDASVQIKGTLNVGG